MSRRLQTGIEAVKEAQVCNRVDSRLAVEGSIRFGVRKGLGEGLAFRLREAAMQGSGGKAVPTLRPTSTNVLRWQ